MSFWVGGVAVVAADIRFTVLVVDDPEKEQLPARQQHPVRRRILIGRDDRKSVAVPRDQRRRLALGLAVERRRLGAYDILVLWVLNDPRICPFRPRVARRRRCVQQTMV